MSKRNKIFSQLGRPFGSLPGQSILEVIVAVGVIATSLVGALSLVSSNLTSAAANSTQVMAYNFAREGIEVVRAKRDSNWLASQTWNNGLHSQESYEQGRDYTAVLSFDQQLNDWELDWRPDGWEQPATQIFLTGGLFAQPQVGGQATNYRRLLHLLPLCQDNTIRNSGEYCDPQTNPQIGLKLKVLVAWLIHDQQRDVVLEENIYDWR